MEELEKRLQHHLLPLKESPLYEPVHYALFSGGKRVRPQLLLLTLDALGISWKQGLDASVALEMIHTYSLIHDDLPAMDNDTYRRGKFTLHVAFSESTAILTGDLLLTYAFELLATLEVNPLTRLSLIQSLAKASGPFGMIGGQWMDLAAEGKKVANTYLEEMHQKKTGALIAASFEMGAILAGKPVEVFQQLGMKVGLAFQIRDDLLDPLQKQSDEKKEKATALTTLGQKVAYQTISQLWQECSVLLAPYKAPLLLEVLRKIFQLPT